LGGALRGVALAHGAGGGDAQGKKGNLGGVHCAEKTEFGAHTDVGSGRKKRKRGNALAVQKEVAHSRKRERSYAKRTGIFRRG